MSIQLRQAVRRGARRALAAGLAILFVLASAAASARQGDLDSPLDDLKQVEKAILESGLPKLSVQHRGLDITLAHYARYQLHDFTGRSKFPGEDPVFTYLGMMYAPERWANAKMFRLEHPKLAARFHMNRKDRLAPNDMTPETIQTLTRLERLGKTLPGNHARRLADGPASGGAPLSRDEFGKLFGRVWRVGLLSAEFESAGIKLDIERYKQLRGDVEKGVDRMLIKVFAEMEPDNPRYEAVAKTLPWNEGSGDPWEVPALAPALELLYGNYLLGSIPADRTIDFMAYAAREGGADLAGLQSLINDVATFGFPDKTVVDAIGELEMRYAMFRNRMDGLQMVAIPDSLENLWVAPVEAARQVDSPVAEAAMGLDAALRAAYRSGKTEALAPAVGAFLAQMRQDERYTSDMRRAASYFYSVKQPFFWTFFLYFGAAVFYLPSLTRKRASGLSYKAANALLASGFALHTLGIGCRIAIMTRAPVSNIWESLIWVTWGGIVFGSFFEFRYRTVFPGFLTALTGFVALVGAWAMPEDMGQMQPLRAVLISSWLTYHVLAITLSYAAFMISAVFSACHLAKESVLAPGANGPTLLSKAGDLFLPPAATLELFAYRAIQIGYPLLTWGIFSGAVWADHAWGRFWAWDPKETWSLITWLIYTAFLHMRLRHGLKGRSLALMSLGGFACVLTTWLGVSYLPIFAGLHSYASG